MENKTTKNLLGLTSLENEVTKGQLPVRGQLPSWLTGTLIRNGPAKFEVGNDVYRHWFDGLAMLHKFSFKDGQVYYANKFLQSNAYKKANETGKICFREFATDPCRSIFRRVQSMYSPEFADNTNVNVARIGSRFIAMTETPIAVEFDSQTLKTIGIIDGGNQVSGGLTTAHPHYDFTRMKAVNYITRFSEKSTYNIYGIPDGTTTAERELIGSIQVDEPGYMHSFGMTENYVILAEFPLVVQPKDIFLTGKPFIENFQWKPEKGTRFIVMDKQNGTVAATYQGAPFFAFHHVNAFETRNEIIMDIIAYKDSSIIRSLYLDILKGESPGEVSGELRRYHIPFQGSEVDYEVLSKDALELPRINYRKYNTKDYRFLYATGPLPASRLLKVDIQDRKSHIWSENGCYVGEPVFVSRPNGVAEDDGIILSVVLDSNNGNSFLLLLDAKSFKEIARAEAPHHIPFGFHGQYYGDIN